MAKNTLQTLERGIQVLEIVSATPSGIKMADLAEAIGVHRTIAYRIVSTLEEYRLVFRPGDNRVYIGSGILKFSGNFVPQLRSLASPLLQEMANQTQSTAFISLAQGNECTVIAVEECDGGDLRVSYRVGSTHPIGIGAAGLAILAGRKERKDEAEAVKEARRQGYSVTRDQIESGASGLACCLLHEDLEASLGIVRMGDFDVGAMAEMVKKYTRELSEQLSGRASS